MIAKFNLTTKFNELKINPTQFIIVDGNRKRLMQDEYLCYIVDGDDIVCSAVRCQVYSNEVTYCLWYDGDWISNGPVTDIDITDLEFNDHGKCVSGDGEFQDFIDNYLSKKNLPTTTHSDITPKVGNISEFKT
jgi:hypothetical protein